MAVKIIDEGPDPSVVKQVICPKCGCKLQYVPLDVKSQNYKEIDGGSDTSYWIACPKCRKDIGVNRPSAF